MPGRALELTLVTWIEASSWLVTNETRIKQELCEHSNACPSLLILLYSGPAVVSDLQGQSHTDELQQPSHEVTKIGMRSFSQFRNTSCTCTKAFLVTAITCSSSRTRESRKTPRLHNSTEWYSANLCGSKNKSITWGEPNNHSYMIGLRLSLLHPPDS